MINLQEELAGADNPIYEAYRLIDFKWLLEKPKYDPIWHTVLGLKNQRRDTSP